MKQVNVMMQLRRWGWLLCLGLMVIGLSACGRSEITRQAPPAEEAATAPLEETVTDAVPETAAADPTAGLPVLNGSATVALQVNGEQIVIEVDGSQAPVTAGNFVDLVQRGVYDGVIFHRVVKSPDPFVVQTGDPQTKDPDVSPQRYGTGSFIDPGTKEPRLIPLEIQPQNADRPLYSQTFEEAGITAPPALPHRRGAVAMARSQLPDSASSQFYIALADLSFLDGNYAVFGYVTEGMEVVERIEQGDVLESATVVTGLDNLQQPD